VSDESILYETHSAVATITLNRPEVLNALTRPLLTAFKEALQQAEAEGRRCLIITGAGRGFCAGQDLAGIRAGYDTGSPDLQALLREYYHPVVRGIRGASMPVVAAINGVAAGAGLSLALACDVRIVMEGARMTTAFTRIGLVPDAGMAWTLPLSWGGTRGAAHHARRANFAAGSAGDGPRR
jgi:2-(1,2-epoxy-1,2-dihydrophenyl)acetyl-CoA isomerase